MDKFLSDKKAILLFVVPALLFYMLIIFVSIAFSGYYSLLDWNGRQGSETFIGLSNYFEILTPGPNSHFVTGLKNALLLALLSVFAQIPIALVLALAISRKTKGEGFFRSVFFIPVIISTSVLGQLWLKIYNPNNGMLNNLLTIVGLDSWTRGWLADTTVVLGAVFFVMIWQYVGYHMLLLYSQMKSIPISIYEAAEIDGASSTQVATKITIPLIMPMIKVCTVFAVIGSLKAFDFVWILTKGGPFHTTEVPTTVMFRTIISQGRFGAGSAMAILILVACLILTVLIMRLFKVENYEY